LDLNSDILSAICALAGSATSAELIFQTLHSLIQ